MTLATLVTGGWELSGYSMVMSNTTRGEFEDMVWALGNSNIVQYLQPGHRIAGFDLVAYIHCKEWFFAKVMRIEGDNPTTASVFIKKICEWAPSLMTEIPLQRYQHPWAVDAAAAPAGSLLYKIPQEPFSSIPIGQRIVTCGGFVDRQWKPATFQGYDSSTDMATIQFSDALLPTTLRKRHLQPFLVEVGAQEPAQARGQLDLQTLMAMWY
jgi:hypothetical protein